MEGPIRNRHCTDKIMLVVFFLFVGGLVVIAGLSVRSGDPRRIVFGTDSWGNLCGRNNRASINRMNSGLDLTNFPYLFYADPPSGFRICVEECPTVDIDCASNNTACVNTGLCSNNTACVNTGLCLNSPQSPYGISGGSPRARS